MCQIIALRATSSAELKSDLEDHRVNFKFLLEKKGEDYYAAGVMASNGVNKNPINFSMSTVTADKLFTTLGRVLGGESFVTSNNLVCFLFSRQKPEMETSTPETQPYFTNKGMIAIHGTIINDQEIAKELGVKIDIDTEVFKYLDIDDSKIHGTYAAIECNDQMQISTKENGLKLWRQNLPSSNTSVISTGNLDFLAEHDSKIIPADHDGRTLFAAFSGGMDIALSTYAAMSKGYNKVILNYFDWGSVAAGAELKTLDAFKEFYNSEFDIDISINIINCGAYFDNFFDIAGIQSKIADAEAQGEASETEAPIAYVPYRNTQFAMLLASIAEGQELKNVDILFGLNLSEGMVFMDNSEGWLNAMQETIRYGGKSFEITGSYNIIAPYFPRTKTNMIKEFKEEFGHETINSLLELSYSCYYPQADGSACGKCGSCILREKAISNL